MLKKVVRALTSRFRPVSVVERFEVNEMPEPTLHRGLIEYDAEQCSFCDQCEKVCPHNAIIFYQHADGTKEYAYNPFLCEYCGECVKVCPSAQDALWQCEIRPVSNVDEEDVMATWAIWRQEAAKSRCDYRENRA